MKKWTIYDDIYLYEMQPVMTVSELAEKLGTSKDNVRARIKLIGLRNYESEMPRQQFIYRMLTLHKDTVDNRLTLANRLGLTMGYIGTSVSQVKRQLKNKKATNCS